MSAEQLVADTVSGLPWCGPDTHVQVQTGQGRLWRKAWTTGAPGLLVVYDEDHDVWSLTHKGTGKAVVRISSGMVQALRHAAYQLHQLDWTGDEESITEQHHQAATEVATALVAKVGASTV